MEKLRQREVDENLGSISTAREVTQALGKLKNGKAPGSLNVLPEMLNVAINDGEFGQIVWTWRRQSVRVSLCLRSGLMPSLSLSPRREICVAVTTGRA